MDPTNAMLMCKIRFSSQSFAQLDFYSAHVLPNPPGMHSEDYGHTNTSWGGQIWQKGECQPLPLGTKSTKKDLGRNTVGVSNTWPAEPSVAQLLRMAHWALPIADLYKVRAA